MDFVRYILGDFWHFAGFVFILWIVLVGKKLKSNDYEKDFIQ